MRFYTEEECARWCGEMAIPLENGIPLRSTPIPHWLRCAFPPKFSQLLWFSRCIEDALQPRTDCLVWVTEFGVWPSSENRHLYYRLRQSYGDTRLLHEAPGHFCLEYERPEVVTLVYLGLLFGWDIHLLPVNGYARAFVCHDEWVQIGFDDPGQLDETRSTWEKAGLDVSLPP